MTQSSPAFSRAGVAIKAILLFVLTMFALLGLLILLTALGSPLPLLLILVVAALIGMVSAAVLWLLRRRRPDRAPFWRSWLNATAIWGLLLLALVSIPYLWMIYVSAVEPLSLPRIVLSNGKKEVIYQGMVHVGSEPFYQGIVFDMVDAADKQYELLFEGVQGGSPENEQRFNELMGTRGTDLNQMYDSVAQQCNLHFQNDYFRVFGDDMADKPDQFITADVSVDDMMAEWDRLTAADPALLAQMPEIKPAEAADQQDDTMAGVLESLKNLTPGQQSLVGLACQTMFNMTLDDTKTNKSDQSPFMEKVVLEYRNRHLADTILQSPAEHIYITYGADHFKGVYKLLQAADPAWTIKDVSWRQAIEDRVAVENELQLDQ